MPTFDQHQSFNIVKLMNVADSGGGKTGALACLANAGYNLRILDFDNGLDILGSYLTPEGMKRVSYHTLIDKRVPSPSGPIFPTPPTAFQTAMKLLNSWESYGSISTWGDDTVLVVDSLTMFSDAVFNYVLAINQRLGMMGNKDGPRIQDYGMAMDKIEEFIILCMSDSVKCHVIFNTHIMTVTVKTEGVEHTLAYPMALGKRLPPKIPRYFNTVVRTKTVGSTRMIETAFDSVIELKNPAPNRIPAQLPISDGLLTIFKTLRGRSPVATQEKK